MINRLLDTLLPAIVLVGMVFAMASGFGALSAPPVARTVKLERVVINGQREVPATAVAQTSAPDANRTVR